MDVIEHERLTNFALKGKEHRFYCCSKFQSNRETITRTLNECETTTACG